MINCDPSVLQNQAACFTECIQPGMERAVTNYLLAQILNAMNGASTDPKVIVQAAAGFTLHFGFEDAVTNFLLCQIATAAGA